MAFQCAFVWPEFDFVINRVLTAATVQNPDLSPPR